MDAVQRWKLGILTAIIFLSIPASISANPLTDEMVSHRIDFIQKRLDQGTNTAKIWQYSWMAINGGASCLQFGLAISQDKEDEEHDRYDNVVGGITGFLAVGDLALNPLVAWSAAKKLRQLPASTPAERSAKLQQGEKLLKACAKREAYGRSWKTHVLAGLVNALAGVAIAMDDNRSSDGFAAFASGMAVSEIQIFTMPTRATTDWEEYRNLPSGGVTSRRPKSFRDRFFLSANAQSLRCTILF